MEKRHLERLRAAYSWDIRHYNRGYYGSSLNDSTYQYRPLSAIAAGDPSRVGQLVDDIQELTVALGGLQVGDYIHVPKGLVAHASLNITAPSDKSAEFSDCWRMRVIEQDGGRADDICVIHPDSHKATKQSVWIPSNDVIWTL